jgi:glyoxylase-like metal-dependent hydrolase (beta-lactamase superfamily II)
MRRLLTNGVVALAAIAVGCSSATPEMAVVQDAAEAMGGAAAIRAATTLVVEGNGTGYRLGQNFSPDSDLPQVEIGSVTLELDLVNHRRRLEDTRANFLGNMVTTTVGIDGSVVFAVGNDGSARRLGAAGANQERAAYYFSALALMQAALVEDSEMAATVSNLRQDGMGHNTVDIATRDGVQLTLHLDATTNLPAMITTTGYNENLGDVTVSGTLNDWRETNGLILPWALSIKRDDFPDSDYQATSMTVGGPIGDLAAPAEVASAPEPEPAQANVVDEELADGIWHLAGQSHHSVLVEFPTYGVLIEAPQNDTRALAVIARARELLPDDKRLCCLVNTHHHFDHSGGLRAAVAEGLTVITHEINADWYRSLVARPHTVRADHLAQNPAELMIETVKGDEVFELSEGNRTMQIRRLQNDSHNEGMLVVYLPAERLLIEADVYSPPRGGPTATNLYEQIQAMGLNVDRIAPIHGQVVPIADLEKTAMADPVE